MYRLSRLRFIFPIGLFISFALDGSFSKIFGSFMFSYPYSMVSHLVVLWLVLACFFEEDVNIPLIPFSVAIGLCADIYYSGVLGLFIFLYPLIIWLTRIIKKYFSADFLSVMMIFFIDIAVFEFLNYIAYSVAGVVNAGFTTFTLYTFAPTLALNLVYCFVLYFPISMLYDRFRAARRA